MAGLKREFSLLYAFPPTFTHAREGVFASAPFRAVEFDNAPTGDIYRLVDSPERWLYLYLRQSSPKVGEGVFCAAQRTARDADFLRGDAIMAPVVSGAVNVRNDDFDLDGVERTLKKIVQAINAAAAAAKLPEAEEVKALAPFTRVELPALLKRHARLGFDDAVSLQANEAPTFVTGLKGLEQDARDARLWESLPYKEDACGGLYARVKRRTPAVPFVEIGLHPTHADLGKKINVFGPLYREQLEDKSSTAEWSLGFTINLAPILT